MTKLQISRVAELLFIETPICDFARTITDLDALLTRICGDECKLTWDCDDVASFDMPGTRILLNFSDSPYATYEARMVLSVGPSDIPARPGLSPITHEALCNRLVARLQSRCEPTDLRWHDIAGVVTADDVDQIATASPPARPRVSIFGHRPNAPRKTAAMPSELAGLRTALHPYGLRADLPAASSRLAHQTVELAASLATIPFAAAHFAATLYRAAHG